MIQSGASTRERCPVVAGQLTVVSVDGAPLLQASDAVFDHIAPLVEGRLEERSTLVARAVAGGPGSWALRAVPDLSHVGGLRDLINAMISEAAARGGIDSDLVSVDSTLQHATPRRRDGGAPDRLQEFQWPKVEERGFVEGLPGPLGHQPGNGTDPQRERRRGVRRRREDRPPGQPPKRAGQQDPPADRPALSPAVDRAHPRTGRRHPPLHTRDEQDLGPRPDRPSLYPAALSRRRRGLLSRAHRAYLRRRRIKVVIPRKGRPGRQL